MLPIIREEEERRGDNATMTTRVELVAMLLDS